MVSLRESELLDNKLVHLFNSTVVVAFQFHSDLGQFAKGLPKLSFYKHFSKFIDAKDYFTKLNPDGSGLGLAKITEIMMGKKMCKGEQMSNWEMRPLRMS
jgi:hypothetical protein